MSKKQKPILLSLSMTRIGEGRFPTAGSFQNLVFLYNFNESGGKKGNSRRVFVVLFQNQPAIGPGLCGKREGRRRDKADRDTLFGHIRPVFNGQYRSKFLILKGKKQYDTVSGDSL
jgi:hypothetical protein